MQSPLELPDILAILPHRPPFLFVDRVLDVEPARFIIAERTLRPDEPFFAGHFPGRPVMPGVLVAEALAQTSGLLLGLTEKLSATPSLEPRNLVLARTNLKYTRPAFPGEVVQLRSTLERSFAGLFRFEVEASARNQPLASGSLTLALAPW